jgi:hypothetical protein
VSILVRSTGRPSLFETLRSIADQHYPNLECVLVCAHGQPHAAHQFPEGLKVREVFGPQHAPLGRPQAANQALLSAGGEYLLFLDDDDLIDPDHISRLVSALGHRDDSPAAYAGVRVETGDGHFIRDYDLPWAPERLQALNFLPIHAVLFRRSAVQAHQLAFREDLPVLEDWDFWRRLAESGPFVHVPGVSARYRKLDVGSGVSLDGENDWKVWQQRLLLEWAQKTTPREQASLLAWHARALDAQEQRIGALKQGLERQIQDALSERDRISREYEAQMAALTNEISGLHQAYGQQVQAALESREALSNAYKQQLQDLDEDRARLRRGFEEQIQALIADRDASIQRYEQTLAALRFDRDALHQKLGRIVNSRLWRFTAPLREVLRWLTHRR